MPPPSSDFCDFLILHCYYVCFVCFIDLLRAEWSCLYHVRDKTNDPMCSLLFTLIVIMWIWQINLFSYLVGQKNLLVSGKAGGKKNIHPGDYKFIFLFIFGRSSFFFLVSFDFFVFLFFFCFFLLVCFVKKISPSRFPETRVLFFLIL